jgi:hypothetical protein
MALLTGVFGGPSDMLCAVIQGTSVLSGMVPMYLLMSVFHAGPWLKLSKSPPEKPFSSIPHSECERSAAAPASGLVERDAQERAPNMRKVVRTRPQCT